MNLELVILDGPQAGRRMPVGGKPMVFGRGASAAISFPEDGYMSGNHLMVQAGLQGVLLNDLHSTNGTFLNGQRINQAEAMVGDTVRLGTLTLQVQPAQGASQQVSSYASLQQQAVTTHHDPGTTVLPQLGREYLSQQPAQASPPPVQHQAPAAPTFLHFPDDPVRDRVMQLLTGADAPLYCLLDAAVDPAIERELVKLQIHALPHNLYSGDSAVTLAQWAPYLFPLLPGSPLLRLLVERGWGKAWASYFTSTASFEELRKHFRRFLMVQVEGKGEVYFRFYDPRVLRDFLPTANLQELTIFFGPVQYWFLEGEAPETMLHLWNSPQGLMSQMTRLA